MTITRPVPTDVVVDAAAVKGGAAAASPTSFTVHGDLEQFAPAWVAALGELEDVPRTRTADAGSYKYSFAELADVLSKSRPILARHGLAAFQVPRIVNGDVSVTTVVMHTSGTFLEFVPFDLPAGNRVQETGSATTYARRYSATSILGLATEDNDGATAGTRPSPKPETLSQQNVDRFLAAAHDNLLTVEEIDRVVLDATKKRTDDPNQVYVTEVAALREALYKHTREPAAADDQYRPAPAESGGGNAGALADPSPDLKDTPDE